MTISATAYPVSHEPKDIDGASSHHSTLAQLIGADSEIQKSLRDEFSDC